MAETQDQLVNVGALRGPHGLKGMVKAKLTLDDPQLVISGGPLIASGGRAFTVTRIQQAGQGMVALVIEGISTLEQAEKLKGVSVFLDRSHWPEDPMAVYLADLLGANIVNPAGDVLGTVGKTVDLPAGPALEILRADGKTVLLPLDEAFILTLHDRVQVTDLGAEVVAL